MKANNCTVNSQIKCLFILQWEQNTQFILYLLKQELIELTELIQLIKLIELIKAGFYQRKEASNPSNIYHGKYEQSKIIVNSVIIHER